MNTGLLTDFISFYTLPSTVMNHPQHSSIKVPYIMIILRLAMNTGVLTDFISFYTLPSTVMNHPQHSSIKVPYI